MIVRTKEQREILIEGGHRLAKVLNACAKKVAPGISTEELDDFAEAMIRDGGDTPAFLGYSPEGASRAYPATLCVSVNDEVVHGIPNESKKILRFPLVILILIISSVLTTSMAMPREIW